MHLIKHQITNHMQNLLNTCEATMLNSYLFLYKFLTLMPKLAFYSHQLFEFKYFQILKIENGHKHMDLMFNQISNHLINMIN